MSYKLKIIDPSMGMSSQPYAFMKVAETTLPRYIEWPITDEFYVETSRYHNCREQGFLWSMCKGSLPNFSDGAPQINFVWYEHRNSDRLCCVKWTGKVKIPLDGSVTYQVIPEEAFPDKYSYTEGFHYFDFLKAIAWWADELQDWYDKIKEVSE